MKIRLLLQELPLNDGRLAVCRAFLILWLMLLPVAFVTTLAWYAIPVSMLIGYELLGYEVRKKHGNLEFYALQSTPVSARAVCIKIQDKFPTSRLNGLHRKPSSLLRGTLLGDEQEIGVEIENPFGGTYSGLPVHIHCQPDIHFLLAIHRSGMSMCSELRRT